MDSALQELLSAELDPDEIVEVLVRLADESSIHEKLTPVAKFGDIVSCRIRREDIMEAYRSPLTRSMKAPRFVAFDEDWEAEEFMLPATGRVNNDPPDSPRSSTIVAVLDWGIDFAHPNFRNPDGSTRFLAIWDQSYNSRRGLAPYGYGRLVTREQINRALQSTTPYQTLRYHPGKSDTRGTGTHGTHVMDIAAGNGRLGPAGVAPNADLIFVHLASRETPTGTLGDSARILEALDAVRRIAGDRNLVVNMSVGRHGGPHDGTTLVEQGIDNFIAARPNTMICQSTGNYFQSRTHHSDIVRPGMVRTFSFLIQQADTTLNEMEIWYGGNDRFNIELINDATGRSFSCPVNGKRDIILNGKRIGRIYHRDKEPNNGKCHINLFLYKSAPSGRWTVKLTGARISDGRYHAWIERDGSCSQCQSRFDPSFANSASTTGTLANGYNTIVCGAYNDTTPEFRVAPFSSRGPTLDGRFKPDILAPGWHILAAKSTPRNSTVPRPSSVRMSGTSMASPKVAGTVARVLDILPENTPYWQIRNLVIGTAAPVIGGDAARVGSGTLNIGRALEAAQLYTKKVMKMRQVPVTAGPDFERPVEQTILPGTEHTPAETFTPSYRSKLFMVSDSNAILREINLVPITAQGVTSETGINSGGKAILIRGRSYPVTKILRASSGQLIAKVVSTKDPSITLGWTMAANFATGLYNESLRLQPAPQSPSPATWAYTVADSRALIRDPDNGFTPTPEIIPIGSFVQLVDTSGKYVGVIIKSGNKNRSDLKIWTARSNLVPGWINILGPNAAWKRGKFIGLVDLVDVVGTGHKTRQIALDSLSNYQQLVQKAGRDGVKITLNSGFRSYPEQSRLYKNWKNGVAGYNKAAQPGRSNHQNGIAFDLNTTGSGGTGYGAVYNWLKQHGPEYGFVRTVRSEHWHWEYRPADARVLKEKNDYRSWKMSEWISHESDFLSQILPHYVRPPLPTSLNTCGFFKQRGVATKTDLINEIVSVTNGEYNAWTNSGGKFQENDADMFKKLVHYWLSVRIAENNQATPVKLVNAQNAVTAYNALTHTSNFQTVANNVNNTINGQLSAKIRQSLNNARSSRNDDLAWSAAFVTFCIRKAVINLGLEWEQNGQSRNEGVILKPFASHSGYGRHAYLRRQSNTSGCYQAFGRDELDIQVGDIIISDRRFQNPNSNDTCARNVFGINDVWGSHADLTRQMSCTHGDIVVEIDRTTNSVIAIGGNVGNSVRKRRYPILANGKLDINNANQRIYSQETNTGILPATGTTAHAALHSRSTSRIFAVLRLVEDCRVIPGTNYSGGVIT